MVYNLVSRAFRPMVQVIGKENAINKLTLRIMWPALVAIIDVRKKEKSWGV